MDEQDSRSLSVRKRGSQDWSLTRISSNSCTDISRGCDLLYAGDGEQGAKDSFASGGCTMQQRKFEAIAVIILITSIVTGASG
jgi:hypothetical protein